MKKPPTIEPKQVVAIPVAEYNRLLSLSKHMLLEFPTNNNVIEINNLLEWRTAEVVEDQE